MRTTVDLNDEVMKRAQEHAPGMTKTALINEALRVFARQEARKKIAGGALYQPDFVEPPRPKMS